MRFNTAADFSLNGLYFINCSLDFFFIFIMSEKKKIRENATEQFEQCLMLLPH